VTARTDWYRSTEWGEVAERDFRERLARARPYNRIQYRRIKGGTLLGTADAAKRAAGSRLLLEVIESSDAPAFERAWAHSDLGRHAFEDGRLAEAEAHLRESLNVPGNNGSGLSGMEEVWLARVALTRADPAGLQKARDLVERRAANPPLILSVRFEICRVAAELALALQDKAAAASWARAALKIAGADHSGLANHPTLGLVTADSKAQGWLSQVAEAS
jgi:hypothetical protein